MHGDDEESAKSPRAFGSKKVWQRMTVMLAGSFMNFLLAFIIFFCMTLFGNSFTLLPIVGQTVEGSPAALAGLQAGDKVTHINGSRVHLFEDVPILLAKNGDRPAEFRVRRDGKPQTVTLTPRAGDDGVFRVGFYPQRRLGHAYEPVEGFSYISVSESVEVAYNHIVFFIKMTVDFLVQVITRSGPAPELVGVVGFFGIIEDTYEVTVAQSAASELSRSQMFMELFSRMLILCAFLSANLGILNLLPLPALDGGRMMFLILEGIRRKPVSMEREGMVHFVGFVLLIALAVVITFQDIRKRSERSMETSSITISYHEKTEHL
jgi:regulator of sigma E protease